MSYEHTKLSPVFTYTEQTLCDKAYEGSTLLNTYHTSIAKNITMHTYLDNIMVMHIEHFYTYVGAVEMIVMFESTIITEGNTAMIICEAIGYPPPTIIWSVTDRKLSDRVSISDNVSVPIGNGNVTRVTVILTINTASREDTGDYICSANNSIGSDSINVSITVQCKLFVMCCTCMYHH